MPTLRARISRIKRQANDNDGKDGLLITLINDDDTHSVNGTTMTEEEFESWSMTLKPDQVVLILDFQAVFPDFMRSGPDHSRPANSVYLTN